MKMCRILCVILMLYCEMRERREFAIKMRGFEVSRWYTLLSESVWEGMGLWFGVNLLKIM